MTTETVTPIVDVEKPTSALGRPADLIASILASVGAVLSVTGAIWFFSGFAENDTRPEHLLSAAALTLLLFCFAGLPFSITARFARGAYRRGTRRAHLLWTIFLMLPWIGLGAVMAIFTPLPLFIGISMSGLAMLLSLWASVSLVLDWNAAPANTLDTRENEVSVTTE